MNKPIKLGNNQRKKRTVTSPLLQSKITVSDEEMVRLLRSWIDYGRKEDLDKIVLGNLFIVENIVSRMIAHWPDTNRFVHDMISEGAMKICLMVNQVKVEQIEYFRASLTNGVRNSIERFLHRNRSSVNAALSTEYARINRGDDLPPKQDQRYYE